uniref:CXXC-type domain-containing protein n=1 Tax=Dicyema japonicum TaxID=399803 RepID=B9ZYW0_DICJA|nr:hypothetical protein [Dicyema japonicum]
MNFLPDCSLSVRIPYLELLKNFRNVSKEPHPPEQLILQRTKIEEPRLKMTYRTLNLYDLLPPVGNFHGLGQAIEICGPFEPAKLREAEIKARSTNLQPVSRKRRIDYGSSRALKRIDHDFQPVTKGRSQRRRRCGFCGPCNVRENCNSCKNCLNRKILKQSCIYRKCIYLRDKPIYQCDDSTEFSLKNLTKNYSESEWPRNTSKKFSFKAFCRFH